VVVLPVFVEARVVIDVGDFNVLADLQAQAETLDERAVTLDVDVSQVAEEALAAPDR